jgi:hypothetical protein
MMQCCCGVPRHGNAVPNSQEAAAAMKTNDALAGRPRGLWKRHAEGKS